MESYVSVDKLDCKEENAVKEFFALGWSRYLTTHELSDGNYFIYSYVKCRPSFVLDYKNDSLIAPRNRALNPLLREYAEREELEFRHGDIGQARGAVISTIKLRHPPTIDDSDWFKQVKLKEKKSNPINDYIEWAWSTSSNPYGVSTTETEVAFSGETITVPSIERVEAQEYNRCPDPQCPSCNPEARQEFMNRQRELQSEYVRASLQPREPSFGSSAFAEPTETIDEMPF